MKSLRAGSLKRIGLGAGPGCSSLFLMLATLLCGLCAPSALAAGFSLSATNVTLNAKSGIEVPSTVTFQSLDGYTGTVVWACGPAATLVPKYSPFCTTFPVVPLSLTANGSATRTVRLVPYGFGAPLARTAGFPSGLGLAVSILLAWALLRHRRRSRWHGFAALLAIAVSLSGCGGYTAHTGTFTMVVVAQDASNPQIAAHATFTATVQ